MRVESNFEIRVLFDEDVKVAGRLVTLSPGQAFSLSKDLSRELAHAPAFKAPRATSAAKPAVATAKQTAAEKRKLNKLRQRFKRSGSKTPTDDARAFMAEQKTASEVAAATAPLPAVVTVAVPKSGAKLDADKVRKIRSLMAAGKTRQEVAGMFGVSPAAVANIVLGRAWVSVK